MPHATGSSSSARHAHAPSIRITRPAGGHALGLLLAGLLLVTALVPLAAPPAGPAPPASATALVAQHRGLPGSLPVVFERNVGQAGRGVRYLAHAGDATLLLKRTSAVIAGASGALTMRLRGADSAAAVHATGALPGIVSYLHGNDRARWHTNISTSRGVAVDDAYPGVDVRWYGAGEDLEYDFVVAPGGDPRRIAIDIGGARKVARTAGGDLAITMRDGTVMRHAAPVLYQRAGGRRVPVAGSYALTGTTLRFRVGRYDRSRALTIDPLLYSTMTGGADVKGVAVDAQGNAYLAGTVSATSIFVSFQTTPGAFQPAPPVCQAGCSSSVDGFVAKLDPSRSGAASLVYATYVGGVSADVPGGIAIDGAGNAVIAGNTNATDYPLTPSAFQSTAGGTSDAFVTKLNATGTALLYSSRLGGTNNEQTPNGVALDGAGNIYLTGTTRSTDFPVAAALQPAFGGGTTDAFVAKFDPSASGPASLVYSTFLGGSGSTDIGHGITSDAAGNVLVVGRTDSPNFPGTAGSPIQAVKSASTDAFLTKIAADGQHQLWGTFLGGTLTDRLTGVAIDGDGNVVVGGSSDSTNFPTTAGAYQPASAGGRDDVIAKVASDGSALVWSTYLGGSAAEATPEQSAIDVDAGGNVWVTGGTPSTNFPTVSPTQATNAGGTDVFVSKLDPAGRSLLFSTYLGGGSTTQNDIGGAIAVSDAGYAYVGGTAAIVDDVSKRFPTTPNALKRAQTTTDAFFSVLGEPGQQADLALTSAASASSLKAGVPLTFTLTVTNAGPSAASAIVVRDTLPANVTFTSAAVAPGGSCDAPSGAMLTCTIAPLFAGRSATITVRVVPEATGTITNAATVATEATDTAPGNDATSAEVEVTAPEAADLSIEKTASPAVGVVGNRLRYTLRASNAGPDSALATTVTDTLPAGLTFDGASASQGSCSGSATVTCALGRIDSAKDATITIDVTPTTAGSVTNTAAVTSSSPDPDGSDDAGSVTTTVVDRTADLTVSNTDFPDPVAAGAGLRYKLVVANDGPSPATSVALRDDLPPGAALVSATASQGTCSGTAVVTCALGTIASGAQALVTLTTTAPPAAGTITNTASATAVEIEPTPADNAASQQTTVGPASRGGLPSVVVRSTTAPMPNMGSHRGMTVTAACSAGSLVGGGSYLRNATNPDTIPTNGLVLGGTSPSAGSSPVDEPVSDRFTDARRWFTIANFTGVSEPGDQAASFAMCASNGPSLTVTRTASTVGANTLQLVEPPQLTTATCGAGTRLIGGGAVTSTPDQINDGTTAGNNGNLKPLGSYPSNAAGVAAADGSTTATSWTAYGSAGIKTAVDKVTAYALCTSDPIPPVRVARVDVTAQATPFTTASPRCPAGTRLMGGGYGVDWTVNGIPGLQPQQGDHLRGSYPSVDGSATPVEVADGTTNPDTWTSLLQAGGQGPQPDRSSQLHGFAMCATPAPEPPAVESGAASALTPSSAALAGTVDPSGLLATYVFEYGTTLEFGAITSPQDAGIGTDPVPVGASLSGLAANTTYYYRLVASNSAGTTFGTVRSFKTSGTPQAPVAVTLPATSTGDTTAAAAGLVDPNGQQTAFTFEYGTSTAFGAISAVVALDDAFALEPVSATLTGLQPDTTYYFRVVAANATGSAFGAVRAFTTGPGGAPIVTTGAAGAVTSTGATLAGTVDAHGAQTAFAFEYGQTNAFGSLSAIDSAGAGSGAQAVSLPISGLLPGHAYRYRIVATNVFGTTAGAVRSFTTSGASPRPGWASVLARVQARRSSTVGAKPGRMSPRSTTSVPE